MNRRTLFQLSPSLLLPASSFALPNTGKRKFLFIFCPGGWDQCTLFAPLFDSNFVDMEMQSDRGFTQGITYVDSESRPSVRSYLEEYGDRTCFINGFESRSVAHDVCLRLVTTGSPQSDSDDWASIISAHHSEALLMPSVHLSGPSFTNQYSHVRTQLGRSNQLRTLLSTPSAADDMEDEWLRKIMRQHESSELLETSLALEQDLQELQSLSFDFSSGESFSQALNMSKEIFSQQLSRTILLSYNGVRDLGWDTHAANEMQSWHFEELFSHLSSFLEDIDTQQQIDGTPLSEDLCIVLLSEMGRFPKLNFRNGRDHWTYTSAILIGSGIEGGQSIGGYDDFSLGLPIQLSTGEIDQGGTAIDCNNIGATLLTLADIDPVEFTTASPIYAAIKS